MVSLVGEATIIGAHTLKPTPPSSQSEIIVEEKSTLDVDRSAFRACSGSSRQFEITWARVGEKEA